jgi:hypothetical protein
VAAAAGQRDLAAPGIVVPLGSLYQKDFERWNLVTRDSTIRLREPGLRPRL